MAAHRYRSTFNGITFNAHLDDSGLVDDPAHLVKASIASDYFLDSLDLTRVTVEDFREMRQFLEGAEANDAVEGVLFAVLRGEIHGSSPADLEDKTWALRAAFSPMSVRLAAAGLTPKGLLPYDFKVDTNGGSSARRIYARPAIGRPVVVGRVREGLVRRYLCQLIAYDPRVVSQALHTTAVALGGGNLTNAGTVYAWPTISIAFSGVGNAALTITNSTTGKSFVIDASTSANGQTWVIDTYAGTIVRQSDGANRYSQRVSGYMSDQYLLAGVNAIAFANTTNVSSITFAYRDAWA